ncbi:hypothetical protein DBR11_09655 [Pedobacter sp. HMWF019]|uniref:LA_2272 family surface repeat-containing protein n=1 Tax=Pedobacter sp. HMWF019 TaxID=2056856 RepID=UPI000D36A7EF|nr:hypothetical protein [Pedobacter sp. HMWF019]PTT00541.1 hypothetical protein DBR11_09655 [Pedobacter sp. HMWF019]
MREYFYKTLFFLTLFCTVANAQNLLQKEINLEVKERRLSLVLEQIASKGGFSFSYNGLILPQDSLVSISVKNMPISVLLTRIIRRKVDYLESGHFIVIRGALKHLGMITSDIVSGNNLFSISGIVVDQASGERLQNASVYEKLKLVSTLTDEHGYFRLRLRSNGQLSTGITLSKQGYRDTTIFFLETISVFRGKNDKEDKSMFSNSNVEHTGFGNALISARKKFQSLNITGFFANRPFQVSVAPDVSTRGMMGPQVINNFSLNLTGGYTGGVEGVEMAGVFNINKMDMRYFQMAGIFNLTGGTARGLQLAGVNNRTLGDMNGLQAAGFINSTEGTLRGVQISALNNSAGNLKGVQVGLVNVADSSSGLSIGLINIIRNGFYSVSYSATGEMNAITTLKTGSKRLYTALIIGSNISANERQYVVGLGLGTRLKIAGPLFADLQADFLLANGGGVWDDRWMRLHGSLNIALSKKLSIFAGPVLNRYVANSGFHVKGYQNLANLPEYSATYPIDEHFRNWLGWQAGIAFNSAFRAAARQEVLSSADWEMEVGLSAGKPINYPYTIAIGTEISVKKRFDESFYGLFTTGYTHFTYSDRTQNVLAWMYPSFGIIPLKAGIRKMIGTKFYIGGDLGFAFLTSRGIDPGLGLSHARSSFLYMPNLGYQFSSRIGLQVRYEDVRSVTNAKQFAVKLSYKFPLSK